LKVDELAALFAADQAGILEDAQVAGERRLAEVEALADLARAEFAGIEVGQDLAPRGGGQRLEDPLHAIAEFRSSSMCLPNSETS
jgi:hypothetical protein